MEDINAFLSGIVVFRIGKKYIHVKPASARDKTFADFFSQEQYDDALMDGMWTQKEAEEFLVDRGYWSKEEEDRIKKITENIETMKVDYYHRFYDSQSKDYIKNNIEKQNENVSKLYSKKYALHDKTCEYIKSYAHVSYLVQKNAFLHNGISAHLSIPIHVLYTKHNETTNRLSADARKIAKSDEWKYRWISLKKSCFENKHSSLTSFQLSIVSWSTFYDNINKSPDKPSEDVINDDIALDGWSIVEKRKREEEEKKTNAEKLLPENMKHSGEVFIPARNAKMASDIMSLNNREASDHIKLLKRDLKDSGSVQEADLTSTRRELQMKSIQMQKENRRR